MSRRHTPRIVIVQARLESQRRLGKGLALIGDKTLIASVIDRALTIEKIDRVILATTVREADDRLIEHVVNRYQETIEIFRGPSEDVQSRFIRAAEPFGDCYLARVTADDPFKDPSLYDQGFDLLEASSADYVSIGTSPIPLGMDIEVFTSQALAKSRTLYPTPENIEHVTIEMTRQPEFVCKPLSVPDLRRTARLTVDYEEDITFATLVAEQIANLGGSFDYLTTLRAVDLVASKESV